MIEEQLEAILVEIRHLRATLEGLPLQSPRGDAVTGIQFEELEVEAIQAAPAPAAPVDAGHQQAPAAVHAPVGSASVTSLITKESLHQLIMDTYNMLEGQQKGKGMVVGEILQEYNAMMVDDLQPEHYPALHQRLVELKQGVANG